MNQSTAKVIINRVFADGGIENSPFTDEDYREAIKVRYRNE